MSCISSYFPSASFKFRFKVIKRIKAEGIGNLSLIQKSRRKEKYMKKMGSRGQRSEQNWHETLMDSSSMNTQQHDYF